MISFLGNLVGTLILVLPFNLFQSWIASKIWLMLVVPLTGWPALTWPILFGIAATLRCIHTRSLYLRRDEDKPDLEREHPWVSAFLSAIVTGFLGPILIYAGAWLVARYAT